PCSCLPYVHLSPLTFFLPASAAPRDLHSFPTRRSSDLGIAGRRPDHARLQLAYAYHLAGQDQKAVQIFRTVQGTDGAGALARARSEEHTSELQSRVDLVCRLLLEKKKKIENSSDQVRPR